VTHPLDLAPAADEYAEYYGRYVSRVPRGDFFAVLRKQADEIAGLFGAFTPAQADFAYAPGKWSVKEVLGHLTDTERVFAYRALSSGRGDPSPLPGFEQDDWLAPAGFGRRTIGDLLAEWRAVRAATIALAEGFPAEATLRRGVASGREFSVRALLHVAPGHTDYHVEVLRERYLGAAAWPT
jgi:hypothetical protein